jgi:hypothetical protein
MTICGPEVFGYDPINIKWSVVRGDTATIRIDFLENDEVSLFDTTGWIFKASSYDPKTQIIDDLVVSSHPGYVVVTASPDITSYWGTTYKSIVSELIFDLQVKIDDTVWTPVIGTINVIGDITGTI